ncbi:unconventional myosin-IXa-like [Schistocerca serialis cubense]|uniref:unconventional myosin-IXa-like n=1 Tax=Schistocerca serialis cubense TaxID=2023355 RepID=UPI00214E165C|nr:unconventional myosin-IXa-like [Schistocerca serialis cubense]
MSGNVENNRYIVQVFVGALSQHYESLSVEAGKQTTSEEIVSCIVERLSLNDSNGNHYELAEVVGDSFGQECKERRLGPNEKPVAVMLLWPRVLDSHQQYYRFYLREKERVNDALWTDTFTMDPQLIRDYFYRFLYQPKDREYPDLCQLPDLNEQTLLDNLKARFNGGHIYTYVGSILIALNPFKFHPIYNPKYVKLYQNRRLGPELPPHIFAVADAAYHCMLKERRNQCIVISGESGSGKTESTNFLLHHLTALSQKGCHGSGVEQTILSAGPVLEAFGNAKTAHNNNSSRFGKFIQVNYKENGMVHGAVVQKYLLEKSRICSQGRNERNYHVFYYLLAGASETEKKALHLKDMEEYHYLSKSDCYTFDSADEKYEFSRLKQSMEMVGFAAEKQRRLFAVLSAVLLLGNVEFAPRKSAAYHHDEAVGVKNLEVVQLISQLLRVRQETLMAALTAKRARASGETLVINFRLPEAIAARDAMAKCLYGALFDWIVMQVNHALLSKKDTLRDHQGNSIGVLDIFGFEDFGLCNSFEQFCINYANEHLQYYFNQHVFKYEQEEYRKEGIRWTNIDFMDNTGCLQLIEGKPNGLLCVLDDQCNFPGATNETLLQKFNSVHKDNPFYEIPQRREAAFIVRHYAGKVKYQATEMREKNLDLMRQDIVSVLKNSSMAFVRELVGADPVAVFRWAIVRAFFRAYFAFHEAGRKHRQARDGSKPGLQNRCRNHSPNENLISLPLKHSSIISTSSHYKGQCGEDNENDQNEQGLPHRLAWSHLHSGSESQKPDMEQQNRVKMEFSSGCRRDSQHALGRVLCPDEARVLERANQIVMKNKSFRPRERSKKGLKNLQTVKTLAGRTQAQNLGGHPQTQQQQQAPGKARKQPQTVTAQFQQSLHSLMDTLNHANPFFIRCIKSNADKIPNKFDNETVQRQLRYTGMLETVRIRQAGYNVRLTYDEFIQLYRILLPKGLLSSQADVRDFLYTLNLNRDNYQLGISKIFLRESEKVRLDYRLHQQIVGSIVTIQRWARSVLERRRFLRAREAAITIQCAWRMYLAQRTLCQLRSQVSAAIVIQTAWRRYRAMKWYRRLRKGTVAFQACARANSLRIRLRAEKEERARQREESRGQAAAAIATSDAHSTQSTDEAFLSKESSQEELDERLSCDKEAADSEGSSGIQEDSESEPNVFHPSSITTPSQHDSSAKSQHRQGESKKTSIGLDVIHLKKKISFKRNKGPKTEAAQNVLQDDKTTAGIRKGSSSDSLSSQRSIDSQRSSESSMSNISVDVTHERLRRQKYPFNLNKITERRESSGMTGPHSDGEVDETVTRSAPPIVQTTALSPFPAPVQAPEPDPVWRRREDVPSPYSVPGKSPLQNDGHKSIPVHKPVRRESRSVSVELFGDTRRRPTLSASVSHEGHSPTEPEAPARGLRRQRAPRGTVCRSAGEELSGGVVIDPSGATKLLLSSESSGIGVPRRPRSGGITTLELRRRNSDPASRPAICVGDGSPSVSKASDALEWKGNLFTIAGHTFRKVTKFSKEDRCVYCSEPMIAIVTQGHKCTNCKKLFHPKCIQNGGVLEMPCLQQPAGGGKPGRRKNRKLSQMPYDLNKPKPAITGKFSLTKTSEFTDSPDKIISDAAELQQMQDFITKKIFKIESEEGEKPSEVDRVFKQALREFKDNLVATYSVANKQGDKAFNIQYKDLIANFLHIMQTVCNQENTKEDFPVTMGVNAFRGFMNEFMNLNHLEEKPSKAKRKKEKKRKMEDPIIYAGHCFLLTIINIPTACEICTSFFMWPIERGLVCQNCKLTCHKKCYTRVIVACGKEGHGESGYTSEGRRVFGVPLHLLATGDGKVPAVVDRLITTIEMHGLYTEGIYRKSGVSSKVKELKARIEDEHLDDINFGSYHVHVLAAVLKSFLREMPEPLLTFDSYEDFLRAGSLTDPHDRVLTLFAIIKKLPKPNFDLVERLVFHLARVASHEDANRMNASSLAIVFAPCILRTNKTVPAQDSLHDIGRQTQCVETIIADQLRKVKSTLADIDTLDSACHTATHRLSSLRSSKIFSPEELLPASDSVKKTDEEEALLMEHIEDIQKEKALLTSTLPSLTRTTSDDDMLSTDLDDGGSLDDMSVRADDDVHQPTIRRMRQHPAAVSYSISGTDDDESARKLKRQSSSDNSVVSLFPPPAHTDCDEDPIMV